MRKNHIRETKTKRRAKLRPQVCWVLGPEAGGSFQQLRSCGVTAPDSMEEAGQGYPNSERRWENCWLAIVGLIRREDKHKLTTNI